ncbi:MAG TPA: DNA methyltransferase [Allosphingosinicella sp.]|nr:DNA methyltransferase [Allosphingosinicella sp.]
MSNPTGKNRPASMTIVEVEHAALIPDPQNTRKHSQAQLVKLEASIRELGFNVPLLIDEENRIIAGHARLLVAERLAMKSIPCVRLSHLSRAQRRALAIADNKIASLGEWDLEALKAEFAGLCELDFPVQLTGFATAEIDFILDTPLATPVGVRDSADAVDEPNRGTPAVTQDGDCWLLGEHRLLCGDALDPASYEHLLGTDPADMAFADPPYNVPIQGHVSGLGRSAHAEFAMASGEMSSEEFTRFLTTYMHQLVRFTTDGSIHFHCMDWRHLPEILSAGAATYAELKALCVWNKTNGGMGSLYRSKHELVLVYKNGTAPHVNNVELGRHGRYRTNVWDYAGANTFRAGRDEELALHPTVKPVSLVADAIRDCSRRGALVLDPFAGSGTTILAAERTGRKAAAIELDPHYVDTAIRRWQEGTGKSAILADSGSSFDTAAARRAAAPAPEAASEPHQGVSDE